MSDALNEFRGWGVAQIVTVVFMVVFFAIIAARRLGLQQAQKNREV
jgi:hypothetical protein